MRYLKLIFFICAFNCTNAQVAKISKAIDNDDTLTLHMRDVVIDMDTTIEYKQGQLDIFNIESGLRISILDNLFRVYYFNEFKNSKLNGIHMVFYPKSNMPQERGNYLNDQKSGDWFYWNEQGKLIKREKWNKGKLLKSLKY